MESAKNTFFLIIGLGIIAGSFYLFLQKPAPAHYQTKSSAPIIKINDKIITVELADTDATRTQGLSGRASLERGSGVLFVFDTPSKYGFWMKDMNFPIDIVWIGEDWKVVSINTLVNPDTYPEVFYPALPVKYVLELNSGEASILGIDTLTQLYFDDQK